MKRVINGKTFNTETATLIAEWSNSCNSGDFSACGEALHLSPKGQYFIAGEGGPFSPYARAVGNLKSGGEGMRLISESAALEWCEHHDVNADTIAEHFNVESG